MFKTEKVGDFQAVYYVAIYGVFTSFDKERLMLLIGFSTNCLMVSWLKNLNRVGGQTLSVEMR